MKCIGSDLVGSTNSDYVENLLDKGTLLVASSSSFPGR